VTSIEDREFIEEHSPGLEVLGHLPVDEGVREADREGAAVYDRSAKLVEETKKIARTLEKRLHG
jgi:CO dehydrogenase nickel-insertion accessory protein CooC1